MDKLKNTKIYIIGAGGIGSFAAFTLAKMGAANLHIIDCDIVEEHNRPSQFFAYSQVGKPKTDAILSIIKTFEDTVPRSDFKRIGQEKEVLQTNGGIIISAVDSIDTRKEIWENVIKLSRPPLYIDARMGGQTGVIYSVIFSAKHNDATLYEETLHDSKNSIQEPCTARAIIYTTIGISSNICNIVRRQIQGLSVPFRVFEDFQLMEKYTTWRDGDVVV